jgi:hypothetical protein
MYVLSSYQNGPLFVWGYPAIQQVPNMFTNPGAYVISLPELAGYLVGVLFVLFLAAGVLQLLGLGSRAVGALGSIMALAGGVYIVLILMTGTTLVGAEIASYLDIFAGAEFMAGLIPYHYNLGSLGLTGPFPGTIGPGGIVILVGGLLGLVGSLMSED